MAAAMEDVRVFVRNEFISRVIGKGGRKIKEIMLESGAHVSVDRDQSREERTVTIRGSPEAVQKAKMQILAITNNHNTSSNGRQSFEQETNSHLWQSPIDCKNPRAVAEMLNNLIPQEDWDKGIVLPSQPSTYTEDDGEVPPNGGGSKNVQCYKCSAFGHISRDCTSNRGRREPTCYKCGTVGHVSRNCPENDSQRKETVSWDRAPYSQRKETVSWDNAPYSERKETVSWDRAPSSEPTPAEPEKEEEEFDWTQCANIKTTRWDHLDPIVKKFYEEHPNVTQLSSSEVEEIRREKNQITVDSPSEEVPNPVQTFEEAFHQYPEILEQIYKQNFEEPSPIQCQAWPVLLSGKNLIGIAQTGTGKTLAFLLPGLIHIDGQPKPREERGGPTVLILSPTRELALQIEEEVQKFNYKGIRSVCVYGGGSRKHQIELVLSGVEIVVATPGRLSDLTCNGHLRLDSVSFMVLDEADRMLDEGFEYEIKKIMIDIRPDCQMAMTSATWPYGVREIAEKYMKDAIRVNVGSLDLAAVHTVTQYVEVMRQEEKKPAVFHIVDEMVEADKVIIFCGRKAVADDVASDLACRGVQCESMHGNMEQEDRVSSLARFKTSESRVMVATDLAARGLDVKDITMVVNYDFPRNIEEYVHRIGRTGRAGQVGVSVTFMTWEDGRHAKELVKIMTEANQEVSEDLQDMASRYQPRPRRGRGRGGRGGGGHFGGGRF